MNVAICLSLVLASAISPALAAQQQVDPPFGYVRIHEARPEQNGS